eukprot:SM000010S04384  [mRNA]  locus=s10:1248142:1251662:+ [translate_table: standard]
MEAAGATADVRADGEPATATLGPRSVLRLSGGRRPPAEISLQEDVLGFKLDKASLSLALFRLERRACFGGQRRVRRDLLLEFDSAKAASDFCAQVESVFERFGGISHPYWRPKRLYVILNPEGGQGKARQIFKKDVEPLFQAANIDYTIQGIASPLSTYPGHDCLPCEMAVTFLTIITSHLTSDQVSTNCERLDSQKAPETQYHRHAKELAEELELEAYDGIVCVSGDGIPVEVLIATVKSLNMYKEPVILEVQVVNGLLQRGSGNGLAKSACHLSDEQCTPGNAALLVIRGNTRSMDVATVSQGDINFRSILNITWGLTSDVDVESEKYRWMGGFRLTFQAIIRILFLRRYRGTFTYIPAEDARATEEVRVDMPSSQGVLRESLLAGDNDPFRSDSARSLGLDTDTSLAAEEGGQWKTIGGTFVLVWLQNTQWAATDMRAAPNAELSDGCLDVLVVQDCSRLQLLSLFLKIEAGDHVKSKFVQYFKIREAKFLPGNRLGSSGHGGYISVDGEVVARGEGLAPHLRDLMEYSVPLQVTVNQGVAAVFCSS